MLLEQASLQIGRLRGMLGEIVQAWLSEWSLLASEARSRLLAEPTLPVILFGDKDLTIRAPDGSEATIALTETLEGLSPIALLRRHLDASDVAVIIPSANVLRHRLKLPKTSPKILRKALYFELARLSPVDPAELYFDFQAAAADKARETEISVRMVRRASVDRALALCHAAGLRVAAIRFEGDALAANWRIFPFDRGAFLRTLWQRFGVPALAALASLLTLLALLAVYARGSASLAQLHDEMAHAHSQALAANRIAAQIRSIGQEQLLLASEKQKPLLIATLAELTRLLPDDTWITDLQVTGKKVRIQGSSKSASHLTAAIDGSRFFADAQFEAPLTQDNATGSSRFDLAFEVHR